jgi:hypothetical protein
MLGEDARWQTLFAALLGVLSDPRFERQELGAYG